MRKLLAIAFFAATLFSPLGFATSHSKPASMTDGEVRKVDKDAKKITIKHGPLQNLDMPGMTMVFQVSDPTMLDQVKVGDRVKFRAEKVDGGFIVTRIETLN